METHSPSCSRRASGKRNMMKPKERWRVKGDCRKITRSPTWLHVGLLWLDLGMMPTGFERRFPTGGTQWGRAGKDGSGFSLRSSWCATIGAVSAELSCLPELCHTLFMPDPDPLEPRAKLYHFTFGVLLLLLLVFLFLFLSFPQQYKINWHGLHV